MCGVVEAFKFFLNLREDFMVTTAARPRSTPPSTPALSPVEAAFVTGLSRKAVDQAIDRREVAPGSAPEGGARSLGYPELVYLRLRRDVGDMLSLQARRTLYDELRKCLSLNAKTSMVKLGPVTVAVEPAVASVRRRLALLRRAQRFVVVDPEVRAGEPVVRGTRVPVYVLADLAAQGAPREELLEDYPSVTPEALDAALLYARLHPRRGRPRAAPWRAAGPGKHVSGPGE